MAPPEQGPESHSLLRSTKGHFVHLLVFTEKHSSPENMFSFVVLHLKDGLLIEAWDSLEFKPQGSNVKASEIKNNTTYLEGDDLKKSS